VKNNPALMSRSPSYLIFSTLHKRLSRYHRAGNDANTINAPKMNSNYAKNSNGFSYLTIS